MSSAPQVAATLAHELAHVHLLADKRLKPEDEDHERVTDLLVKDGAFGGSVRYPKSLVSP